MVDKHYALLLDLEDWRFILDDISLLVLGRSSMNSLEAPFTKVKVRYALEELGKDKAPEPDGFMMAF